MTPSATRRKFNIKISVVSVWLEKNNAIDYQLFKCFNCGTPVLQYRGNIVQLVPGESPAKLPLTVECRNKRCGIKFQFNGVV